MSTGPRDVRFGSNVGHIGTKSDNYRFFFKSDFDFSTFWLGEPKFTEILFEKVPDLYYLGAI